jgi:hypothetical protein
MCLAIASKAIIAVTLDCPHSFLLQIVQCTICKLCKLCIELFLMMTGTGIMAFASGLIGCPPIAICRP